VRKEYKEKRLLAALLALALLLCSFPVVYAEEVIAEELTEEVTVEAQEAPVEVTEPEPEPEAVLEPEPEPEPEIVPEPEPEPEPDPIVIEVEPEEPEFVEVPEEIPAEESEPEDEPEAEEESVIGEDEFEDDLFEFDDDDAGSVSEELLNQFNNPETYEMVEFSGTADIGLKNNEIYYDREVTLVAKVTGVEMSYRLVWEANDGDERGWYTIASGPDYTFTVTRDIVNREYRVVLFSVD
jgi:hypothetical protein